MLWNSTPCQGGLLWPTQPLPRKWRTWRHRFLTAADEPTKALEALWDIFAVSFRPGTYLEPLVSLRKEVIAQVV